MPELVVILFVLCLSSVAYAYVGYPLVLWSCARSFGRRPQAPVLDAAPPPKVSLLIAAYNEEAEIDKRIQSALRAAYPPDRLEVVIASDGSSDRTAEIVCRYTQKGVRLLDYPQRRGKAAVLNSAFAELRGDIVVLSDANTHIDAQAITKLVRWFVDPEIGVVCGRLILSDPATGKNVDSLYWKYETFLKKSENCLGALLGANGAIYAMRKDLFSPIPNETIVDDFVIPLLAKLRRRCQLVYDCEAIAREETPQAIGSEFQRRSRIGAGGFQSVAMLWKLLHPRHGWTAFAFLSHKILRWLCPFFLIGLLLSNLLLLDRSFFRGALLGQAVFYCVSVLAAFLPAHLKVLKPLRLTTMFTGMNTALLVGCWRWLRGTQKGTWKPTARLAQL